MHEGDGLTVSGLAYGGVCWSTAMIRNQRNP